MDGRPGSWKGFWPPRRKGLLQQSTWPEVFLTKKVDQLSILAGTIGSRNPLSHCLCLLAGRKDNSSSTLHAFGRTCCRREASNCAVAACAQGGGEGLRLMCLLQMCAKRLRPKVLSDCCRCNGCLNKGTGRGRSGKLQYLQPGGWRVANSAALRCAKLPYLRCTQTPNRAHPVPAPPKEARLHPAQHGRPREGCEGQQPVEKKLPVARRWSE